MSNRTAAANRAILEAWEREAKLVSEGQGTRDWTPEQQKDILERGKAYDDTGRALDGQHMKSVAKYPKYQGDPDNIQFLTRSEHLEAHKGSWQTPTNWYYDSVTKQFVEFSEEELVPCKKIPLSNPIKTGTLTQEGASKGEADNHGISINNTKTDTKVTASSKINETLKDKPIFSPKEVFNKAKSSKIGQFVVRYGPEIKAGVKFAFWTGVTWILGEVIEKVGERSSVDRSNSAGTDQSDYSSVVAVDADQYRTVPVAVEDGTDITTEDTVPTEKRKSPEEHTVNDQGQRYHYKDGSVRYKEKQPYRRGVKRDEQ